MWASLEQANKLGCICVHGVALQVTLGAIRHMSTDAGPPCTYTGACTLRAGFAKPGGLGGRELRDASRVSALTSLHVHFELASHWAG